MNRAVCTAVAVVLLIASAVRSQPPEPATLRGESTQTRKRLAEAKQKILDGKPADAADELQRILDESGDDLITFDGEQFQTARREAHSLLAKLPPDALKTYQDRIDQPAKKLLDQAKQSRDPRPLWQLLDRYFVSRPADEAILLLGDLLFERGEFRAAEHVWRRLLPDAGADLAYPNSKAEAALVRARVVLAVIFQHDGPRAKEELTAFKMKHPNASGTLAGKTGPLADTLQAFLAAPPRLPPDVTTEAAWTTYGGAPDRASRVPGGIPSAWPGRPSWKADVPEELNPRRAALTPPERPPFGYPVIANDEVFVASASRVYGFSLRTGAKTRDGYTTFLGRPAEPQDAKALRIPDAHGTLTVANGLLYARFGPSAVRAPVAQDGKIKPDSAIVCLSLKAEGKFTELWKLFPPEGDNAAAVWEGAPLVSGRRLWAVYAKYEGGRVVHVAVCYDPADAEKEPRRPAWTAELCDSPIPPVDRRTRQELLTLAGRNLVFCSNSGAVVAIDAVTGKRAWGFRYPRSRKAVNRPTGDPSPAVAFGGRVFVAPADGERIYALDAETGQFVWQSGNAEGVQILGVARNKLIVAVAGPLRSLRGLNLDTGSYREGGWIQADGDILSYGHGFVTDDAIVWPTREGLFFLDPRNGWLCPGRPNPFRGPFGQKFFGHVAYADKILVAVTPTEIWFYRAQNDRIETKPDSTPRNQFDVAVDRAERELAAGNLPRANAILAEVATGDLPPAMRAWAAARMLQLAPPADDISRLPSIVRDVLQPAILNEWILPPDGIPVTLDTLLQRHLGRSPEPASTPVCAEGKACPPSLPADAEIDRTLKLPHAVSPLRPIPGGPCPPKRLFAAGPRVVVAIPLERGAEREYAAPDLFTHGADLRTGIVAAGPHAVALYGTAREPLWVFRVPTTGPLPDAPAPFRFRSDEELPCPHLSSFALAGAWLLARIGEHHLIALDLEARRVAWVLNAGGRAGYEPSPFPGAARFGPHFAVCGKYVVLQLSDGRRWFADLATGKPVAMPSLGEQTAKAWWPHAPASAGERLVLLSDGPGLVRLAQLGGRVKWSFEPESTEGFTGEPAQARLWGNVLLVAVRRNHGVEIERVDPDTGKAMWPNGPAFADADRIDLSAADADAEYAYIPAGNKLLAVSLRDGKTAWEVNLPDTRGRRGWVLRTGQTCVVAYPAEAIPAEATEDVWNRVWRSFRREPLLWRLPGLAATLYDAWVAREVPVLFFDPETGKRLARINVEARGPAVTAWFAADAAVIATGDRVVWLK
jgi:outer membrane protein assembly factor BamB